MSRRLVAFIAATVLVFAASPATARTAPLDSALEILDRTRALVSDSTASSAVDAAAALAQIELAQEQVAGAPVPASVTPALVQPVSRLLGALDAAAVHAQRGIRVSRDEGLALLAEFSATSKAVDWTDPSPADAQRLDALRLAGEHAVDQRELLGGMAVLAQAVDRSLPELAAAASALPPAAGTDGCDLADVELVLCIAGTDDNTIEGAYALVIDLGGDDVHRHTAGAGTLIPGLAIDLGGDDTWEAVPLVDDLVVAQGAGALSIGALVDVAGDDTYRASNEIGDIVVAQGAGALGAGLLADLGGNDTYQVAGRYAGDALMVGLGGAAFGAAAFLDAGGNDRYQLAAAPTLAVAPGETTTAPEIIAAGLGAAAMNSVALFADQGGNDVIAADATVTATDEEQASVGDATVDLFALGSTALGGAAAALTGDGASDVSVTASVDVPAPLSSTIRLSGLGTAILGGLGMADDTGGDDTYSVAASSLATDGARVDDACGCPALAVVSGGAITTTASGVATLGGVGIQRDLGGDDTYEADATSAAVATLTDERQAAVNRGIARATTAPVVTVAQGAATAGVGALLDAAGDDQYQATAHTDAVAEIDAADDDTQLVSAATPGDASTQAQARAIGSDLSAHAELRDLGGVDSYSATAQSTGSTLPDGGDSPGVETTAAQAAADRGGTATFIDSGPPAAGDTFTTSPERAPCEGTRGGDAWVDCGDRGYAVGVNT